MSLTVSISFRSHKADLPLTEVTTVGIVKQFVRDTFPEASSLTHHDLTLLMGGKRLSDDDQSVYDVIQDHQQKHKKVHRIIVTGRSLQETQAMQEDCQRVRRNTPRIRNDLTEKGTLEWQHRRNKAMQLMHQSNKMSNNIHNHNDNNYGFDRIETLPNLPQRDEAQRILESLANDPGIKACMIQHKWRVGSLAELYPEGNVGQSAVCYMGLNRNKGQEILLRLRTDDLQGFRKITSIRKVLYHELAHNVHSGHGVEFFQLMRQIERECTDMDWTRGEGLSHMSVSPREAQYQGGTFRLGSVRPLEQLPVRELAARAALQRLTKEEQDIQDHCGCGRDDIFLPNTQEKEKGKDPTSK